MRYLLILPMLVLGLAGCVSEPQMWSLNDQNTIAPKDYASPMSAAMACANDSTTYTGDIRLGIGIITAEDGVFDYESQGNYTPNSAHHMFITSLKGSGFRVMNRLGEVTKVMEWENQKSMDKLMGDGYSNYVKAQRPILDDDGDPWLNKAGEKTYESYNREIRYRILNHGQLLGSSHLFSGAITSLDFDTSSGGIELAINGVGIGKRAYRMRIGMDLYITNTISGEIEWAKAYEKQYIGVETRAGGFRLIDSELVDFNLGIQTNEPIQAGVHYMVDYIAYDLSRIMRGTGPECDQFLPGAQVNSEESADHGNG